MYFVYKPHFTPISASWFKVVLEPVKALKATNGEAALAEAKRLGFFAPIVGKEEQHAPH